MTHVSLYSSSVWSNTCGGSLSVFFHMKIIDSSSPDARNFPFGDHLTTLTAFWWRVRSAATSRFTEPVSVVDKYQIYNINFMLLE